MNRKRKDDDDDSDNDDGEKSQNLATIKEQSKKDDNDKKYDDEDEKPKKLPTIQEQPKLTANKRDDDDNDDDDDSDDDKKPQKLATIQEQPKPTTTKRNDDDDNEPSKSATKKREDDDDDDDNEDEKPKEPTKSAVKKRGDYDDNHQTETKELPKFAVKKRDDDDEDKKPKKPVAKGAPKSAAKNRGDDDDDDDDDEDEKAKKPAAKELPKSATKKRDDNDNDDDDDDEDETLKTVSNTPQKPAGKVPPKKVGKVQPKSAGKIRPKTAGKEQPKTAGKVQPKTPRKRRDEVDDDDDDDDDDDSDEDDKILKVDNTKQCQTDITLDPEGFPPNMEEDIQTVVTIGAKDLSESKIKEKLRESYAHEEILSGKESKEEKKKEDQDGEGWEEEVEERKLIPPSVLDTGKDSFISDEESRISRYFNEPEFRSLIKPKDIVHVTDADIQRRINRCDTYNEKQLLNGVSDTMKTLMMEINNLRKLYDKVCKEQDANDAMTNMDKQSGETKTNENLEDTIEQMSELDKYEFDLLSHVADEFPLAVVITDSAVLESDDEMKFDLPARNIKDFDNLYMMDGQEIVASRPMLDTDLLEPPAPLDHNIFTIGSKLPGEMDPLAVKPMWDSNLKSGVVPPQVGLTKRRDRTIFLEDYIQYIMEDKDLLVKPCNDDEPKEKPELKVNDQTNYKLQYDTDLGRPPPRLRKDVEEKLLKCKCKNGQEMGECVCGCPENRNICEMNSMMMSDSDENLSDVSVESDVTLPRGMFDYDLYGKFIRKRRKKCLDTVMWDYNLCPSASRYYLAYRVDNRDSTDSFEKNFNKDEIQRGMFDYDLMEKTKIDPKVYLDKRAMFDFDLGEASDDSQTHDLLGFDNLPMMDYNLKGDVIKTQFGQMSPLYIERIQKRAMFDVDLKRTTATDSRLSFSEEPSDSIPNLMTECDIGKKYIPLRKKGRKKLSLQKEVESSSEGCLSEDGYTPSNNAMPIPWNHVAIKENSGRRRPIARYLRKKSTDQSYTPDDDTYSTVRDSSTQGRYTTDDLQQTSADEGDTYGNDSDEGDKKEPSTRTYSMNELQQTNGNGGTDTDEGGQQDPSTPGYNSDELQQTNGNEGGTDTDGDQQEPYDTRNEFVEALSPTEGVEDSNSGKQSFMTYIGDKFDSEHNDVLGMERELSVDEDLSRSEDIMKKEVFYTPSSSELWPLGGDESNEDLESNRTSIQYENSSGSYEKNLNLKSDIRTDSIQPIFGKGVKSTDKEQLVSQNAENETAQSFIQASIENTDSMQPRNVDQKLSSERENVDAVTSRRSSAETQPDKKSPRTSKNSSINLNLISKDNKNKRESKDATDPLVQDISIKRELFAGIVYDSFSRRLSDKTQGSTSDKKSPRNSKNAGIMDPKLVTQDASSKRESADNGFSHRSSTKPQADKTSPRTSKDSEDIDPKLLGQDISIKRELYAGIVNSLTRKLSDKTQPDKKSPRTSKDAGVIDPKLVTQDESSKRSVSTPSSRRPSTKTQVDKKSPRTSQDLSDGIDPKLLTQNDSNKRESVQTFMQASVEGLDPQFETVEVSGERESVNAPSSRKSSTKGQPNLPKDNGTRDQLDSHICNAMKKSENESIKATLSSLITYTESTVKILPTVERTLCECDKSRSGQTSFTSVKNKNVSSSKSLPKTSEKSKPLSQISESSSKILPITADKPSLCECEKQLVSESIPIRQIDSDDRWLGAYIVPCAANKLIFPTETLKPQDSLSICECSEVKIVKPPDRKPCKACEYAARMQTSISDEISEESYEKPNETILGKISPDTSKARSTVAMKPSGCICELQQATNPSDVQPILKIILPYTDNGTKKNILEIGIRQTNIEFVISNTSVEQKNWLNERQTGGENVYKNNTSTNKNENWSSEIVQIAHNSEENTPERNLQGEHPSETEFNEFADGWSVAACREHFGEPSSHGSIAFILQQEQYHTPGAYDCNKMLGDDKISKHIQQIEKIIKKYTDLSGLKFEAMCDKEKMRKIFRCWLNGTDSSTLDSSLSRSRSEILSECKQFIKDTKTKSEIVAMLDYEVLSDTPDNNDSFIQYENELRQLEYFSNQDDDSDAIENSNKCCKTFKSSEFSKNQLDSAYNANLSNDLCECCLKPVNVSKSKVNVCNSKVNNSVCNANMGNNSVCNANMGNNSVVNTNVGNNSVVNTNVGNNSVCNASIWNNSVCNPNTWKNSECIPNNLRSRTNVLECKIKPIVTKSSRNVCCCSIYKIPKSPPYDELLPQCTRVSEATIPSMKLINESDNEDQCVIIKHSNSDVVSNLSSSPTISEQNLLFTDTINDSSFQIAWESDYSHFEFDCAEELPDKISTETILFQSIDSLEEKMSECKISCGSDYSHFSKEEECASVQNVARHSEDLINVKNSEKPKQNRWEISTHRLVISGTKITDKMPSCPTMSFEREKYFGSFDYPHKQTWSEDYSHYMSESDCVSEQEKTRISETLINFQTLAKETQVCPDLEPSNHMIQFSGMNLGAKSEVELVNICPSVTALKVFYSCSSIPYETDWCLKILQNQNSGARSVYQSCEKIDQLIEEQSSTDNYFVDNCFDYPSAELTDPPACLCGICKLSGCKCTTVKVNSSTKLVQENCECKICKCETVNPHPNKPKVSRQSCTSGVTTLAETEIVSCQLETCPKLLSKEQETLKCDVCQAELLYGKNIEKFTTTKTKLTTKCDFCKSDECDCIIKNQQPLKQSVISLVDQKTCKCGICKLDNCDCENKKKQSIKKKDNLFSSKQSYKCTVCQCKAINSHLALKSQQIFKCGICKSDIEMVNRQSRSKSAQSSRDRQICDQWSATKLTDNTICKEICKSDTCNCDIVKRQSRSKSAHSSRDPQRCNQWSATKLNENTISQKRCECGLCHFVDCNCEFASKQSRSKSVVSSTHRQRGGTLPPGTKSTDNIICQQSCKCGICHLVDCKCEIANHQPYAKSDLPSTDRKIDNFNSAIKSIDNSKCQETCKCGFCNKVNCKCETVNQQSCTKLDPRSTDQQNENHRIAIKWTDNSICQQSCKCGFCNSVKCKCEYVNQQPGTILVQHSIDQKKTSNLRAIMISAENPTCQQTCKCGFCNSVKCKCETVNQQPCTKSDRQSKNQQNKLPSVNAKWQKRCICEISQLVDCKCEGVDKQISLRSVTKSNDTCMHQQNCKCEVCIEKSCECKISKLQLKTKYSSLKCFKARIIRLLQKSNENSICQNCKCGRCNLLLDDCKCETPEVLVTKPKDNQSLSSKFVVKDEWKRETAKSFSTTRSEDNQNKDYKCGFCNENDCKCETANLCSTRTNDNQNQRFKCGFCNGDGCRKCETTKPCLTRSNGNQYQSKKCEFCNDDDCKCEILKPFLTKRSKDNGNQSYKCEFCNDDNCKCEISIPCPTKISKINKNKGYKCEFCNDDKCKCGTAEPCSTKPNYNQSQSCKCGMCNEYDCKCETTNLQSDSIKSNDDFFSALEEQVCTCNVCQCKVNNLPSTGTKTANVNLDQEVCICPVCQCENLILASATKSNEPPLDDEVCICPVCECETLIPHSATKSNDKPPLDDEVCTCPVCKCEIVNQSRLKSGKSNLQTCTCRVCHCEKLISRSKNTSNDDVFSPLLIPLDCTCRSCLCEKINSQGIKSENIESSPTLMQKAEQTCKCGFCQLVDCKCDTVKLRSETKPNESSVCQQSCKCSFCNQIDCKCENTKLSSFSKFNDSPVCGVCKRVNCKCETSKLSSASKPNDRSVCGVCDTAKLSSETISNDSTICKQRCDCGFCKQVDCKCETTKLSSITKSYDSSVCRVCKSIKCKCEIMKLRSATKSKNSICQQSCKCGFCQLDDCKCETTNVQSIDLGKWQDICTCRVCECGKPKPLSTSKSGEISICQKRCVCGVCEIIDCICQSDNVSSTSNYFENRVRSVCDKSSGMKLRVSYSESIICCEEINSSLPVQKTHISNDVKIEKPCMCISWSSVPKPLKSASVECKANSKSKIINDCLFTKVCPAKLCSKPDLTMKQICSEPKICPANICSSKYTKRHENANEIAIKFQRKSSFDKCVTESESVLQIGNHPSSHSRRSVKSMKSGIKSTRSSRSKRKKRSKHGKRQKSQESKKSSERNLSSTTASTASQTERKSFRDNVVTKAIISYENEIRPLKEALFSLQTKIKNLNFIDMGVGNLSASNILSSPKYSSAAMSRYPNLYQSPTRPIRECYCPENPFELQNFNCLTTSRNMPMHCINKNCDYFSSKSFQQNLPGTSKDINNTAHVKKRPKESPIRRHTQINAETVPKSSKIQSMKPLNQDDLHKLQNLPNLKIEPENFVLGSTPLRTDPDMLFAWKKPPNRFDK